MYRKQSHKSQQQQNKKNSMGKNYKMELKPYQAAKYNFKIPTNIGWVGCGSKELGPGKSLCMSGLTSLLMNTTNSFKGG